MNKHEAVKALAAKGVTAVPQLPDDDGIQYVAIPVSEAEAMLPYLLISQEHVDYTGRTCEAAGEGDEEHCGKPARWAVQTPSMSCAECFCMGHPDAALEVLAEWEAEQQPPGTTIRLSVTAL